LKKEQREVYIALTDAIDCALCTFCKYYRGSYCDSCSCEHPLSEFVSFPHFDDCVEPGEDCWAFRPSESVDYIANVVGTVLSEGYVEWWSEEKDGKTIVHGSKTYQYA